MGLKLVLLLTVFLFEFIVICNGTKFSKSKLKIPERKQVIVVGGGLAGMSAARRLAQEPHVDVKVFEAMQDRYGGRIWTNRNIMKNLKGVNLEMGAMFLNTAAKNNSLLKLVEEYELETTTAGSIRIFFHDKDKSVRVVDGKRAIELYSEVFKIIVEAVKVVKKSGKDKPLNEAINESFESTTADSNAAGDIDKEDIKAVLNTLPTPLCSDFSTMLYEMESELGWDRLIVGGLDNLIDRIVAGSWQEVPLKIELNKIVRQIKVDEAKGKVLIRTADRKQTEADAVVIALPIGVLKAKNVFFEPLLPKDWYTTIEGLGLGYSSKVIVGFEKAFWPKDIGSFTISSNIASDGFLQMWTNAYRVSDQPFLIGNIFGKKSLKSENVPVDELKEQVLTVLGQMFGEEIVQTYKMTVFVHTKWLSDQSIMGSASYPKVGTSPDMLEILKKPVCPYIFMAGAYTELDGHVDSLHGAYNSGIRAAEQFLTGVCKHKKKRVKSKTEQGSASDKKAKSKKSKQQKDEL